MRLFLLLLLGCEDKPAEETAEPPQDVDGDGFSEDEDCDDGDPAIHPGADEVCDGVDNNCSGLVDIDDPDITDATTYYNDTDGDGYGSSSQPGEQLCSPTEGRVTSTGDCRDGDPDVHPGAEEVCEDGLDNDCDGLVDCEDGQCAWVGACVHPGGVFAEVTGATIAQQVWYYHHNNHPETHWDFHSEVTDITGTVRVLPEGRLWSTATSSITCAWGADRIGLITGLHRESGRWAGVYEAEAIREGFWLEEGCRLSSSSFLPGSLVGYIDGPNAFSPAFRAWADTFTPWYNATLSTTWESSRWGTSLSQFTYRWRTYHRTGSALGGIAFTSFP